MEITLRVAEFQDSQIVAQMLQNLATDIGDSDHYKGSQEAISQYGFGTNKLFHCVIAENESTAVGFAIFFPTFSTTRGEPGVYLQDLWVTKVARGKGAANKLVQHVSVMGSTLWGATHMTLVAYSENIAAVKFYQSMGFQVGERERHVALDASTFQKLIEM